MNAELEDLQDQEKLFNQSRPGSLSPAPPGPRRGSQPQINQIQAQLSDLEAEEVVVGNFVAQCLRQPRPEKARADLSDTEFWKVDLSGIDLKDAILNNANIINFDVRDVDFSQASDFRGSSWTYTAWWRAKKFS